MLRQDVHDRRVDLQRHARFDAVIDNGGDHGALIVIGRFLLDHGCDRDDLLHGHAALVRLFEHLGRDAVVEVLQELVDSARCLHALIELIRVREQEALEALGVALHALVDERVVVGIIGRRVHEVVIRTDVFILELVEDLLHRIALGDGDLGRDHGAGADLHLLDEGTVIVVRAQFVRAGVDLRFRVRDAAVELKEALVLDDAGILELLRHVAHAHLMAGALLGIAVSVRVRNGDVLELGLVERDRRRDRLLIEREHVRRRHPADTGKNDADADNEGKIDQAAEAAAAAGTARRFRLGRAYRALDVLCLHLRLRCRARDRPRPHGVRLLALRARTDRPLRLFGVQLPRLLQAGLVMQLRRTGTDGTLLPVRLHGTRTCRCALLGIRTHRTRLSWTHGALSFRLHRTRLSRARGELSFRLRRTRLRRTRGALSFRLHRTRLLNWARGALPFRLRRTAAGRLCSCRTLRTGRIPLIAEQLIKVLKMIRHGSVSLSTWNSSLPPAWRRNPPAPRGIR